MPTWGQGFHHIRCQQQILACDARREVNQCHYIPHPIWAILLEKNALQDQLSTQSVPAQNARVIETASNSRHRLCGSLLWKHPTGSCLRLWEEPYDIPTEMWTIGVSDLTLRSLNSDRRKYPSFHMFATAKSLGIDPVKVQATRGMPTPTDKAGVSTLLGWLNTSGNS